MKKILFSFLFGIIGFSCNAQIFTTQEQYDKFDDVIKSENMKTLISKRQIDDNWLKFTIETKNAEIKEYLCYMPNIMSVSYGNEEDVIELTDGVYGYQNDYVCCEINDSADYQFYILCAAHVIDSLYQKESPTNKISYLRQITKDNYFVLTERVVTTQYAHTFLNRYFWIRKNDGSRIIYSNERK